MTCTERVNNHRCGGIMKPGKVFVARWCWRGRPATSYTPKGMTLRAGAPLLKKCMKCSKCGHSVFFGNPERYAKG